EEEHRGNRHHDEHHDGGDGGLLAGRPGDLLALGAHFLQELERTDFRHGFGQIGIPSPTFKDETDRRILLGESSSRKSVAGPLTMAASLLPVAQTVKPPPLSAPAPGSGAGAGDRPERAQGGGWR